MTLTRSELRQKILTERRRLTAPTRMTAAKQVAQQVNAQLLFQRAQHIAFYLAVNGELDPSPLLEQAWKSGKSCYLPVLHPLKHNRLWFMPYQPNDPLIKNRFGIFEPPLDIKRIIPPWALDIVFAPLVAFDNQGNRLGMGGGFYDRTFAFLRTHQNRAHPILIGLAYESQKIGKLSIEPWDIPLHFIVTELQQYSGQNYGK